MQLPLRDTLKRRVRAVHSALRSPVSAFRSRLIHLDRLRAFVSLCETLRGLSSFGRIHSDQPTRQRHSGEKAQTFKCPNSPSRLFCSSLRFPVSALRFPLSLSAFRFRSPVSAFALRFPLSGFRFPVSGFRFPVSGLRSPVSGLRSPLSAPAATRLFREIAGNEIGL